MSCKLHLKRYCKEANASSNDEVLLMEIYQIFQELSGQSLFMFWKKIRIFLYNSNQVQYSKL